MRYLRYIIIGCLLILLGSMIGCKGSSVDTIGDPIPIPIPGGGAGTPITPPSAMLVTANPAIVPATLQSVITAYVVDNIGNPVANATVTFSLDSGLKGRLSSGTALTDAGGIATVTFTAGTSTAIATVTGAIGSVSDSATISITGGAGGGNLVLSANPASIATGSTSTISATLTDGSGAPLLGAMVNFILNNTNANFSGSPTASAVTNASGVATVLLTGVAAGSVIVTGQTLGLTGSATVTITTTTGSGSIIATASPTSINTNGLSTITAVLRDSGGALWGGELVSFTVNNPGAGSLSSATATTGGCPGATCGIATVTFTATTIPTSVLVTASYAALSSGVTVDITVPPPASVTVQVNPVSILVLGTSTITATVRDALNNLVPDGTLVTFMLSSSSFGTLSNTVATTANSNGTATTTFIAGNGAGAVTVTATAGSVNNSASINIVPASTGSIQFVSATPQVVGLAGSGQPETSAVLFLVKDINGNPASDGTTVTYSMNGPGGGEYITGSVVGASVATSSTVNGNAMVTLHSGAMAGPVTITATTYVNTDPAVQRTTLSAPVDALVAIIPVVSTAAFPASGVIRLENELLSCTGKTLTTFTGCTRGAISTLTTGHPSGAIVYAQSPIFSQATQISIGGGVPSAAHWNLATSQFNLAGLKYSGLTATISAYIADRFGNYNILDGTALNFYAEGGAIDRQGITDSTGKSSVVIRTQAPNPSDVKNTRTTDADSLDFAPYFAGDDEPWRLGRPQNYNPRDGWVTVLATTMGEEAFLDENANGLFNRSYSNTACPPGYTCECDGGVPNAHAGCVSSQPNQIMNPPTAGGCSAVTTCATGLRSEAFIDLGEPFYDNNDNAKRDNGSTAGYPYEQFIDDNGNSAYNGPNQMWDGPGCVAPCLTSKMIWKDIRLVFSGDYYFWPLPDGTECYSTSGGCTASYAAGVYAVAPAPLTIVKGNSAEFCIIIGDQNLNSLPGGTVLVASASPSRSVMPNTVTLLDGLSLGPTEFCFTVSMDVNTSENVTVVSAGIQGSPPAILNVPLTNPPLAIQTAALPNGTLTVAYTAAVAVTGGTPPYAWSLSAGTLPTGLTLDPSTGSISGTPTGASSSFTVMVTDSVAATTTRLYTIVIN